jgi:hypothetical protein
MHTRQQRPHLWIEANECAALFVVPHKDDARLSRASKSEGAGFKHGLASTSEAAPHFTQRTSSAQATSGFVQCTSTCVTPATPLSVVTARAAGSATTPSAVKWCGSSWPKKMQVVWSACTTHRMFHMLCSRIPQARQGMAVA